MKALLVVDMQEDYVGEIRNRKRFPYQSDVLIARIIQRISDCNKAGNLVIYVINRFFYQNKKYIPQPVKELNIGSIKIFNKNRASCFSDFNLLQYLHDNNITEVEIVGVDGNYCIAASARGGRKNGFSVTLNHSCIGIADQEKFRKTVVSLEKVGVRIVN